jgi:hypothetical protein
MLSAQKTLARETVKGVADVFALELMLASSGRADVELETELGQLRETVLYKPFEAVSSESTERNTMNGCLIC